MLHIATCLWQPNESSLEFSRCYDESWVEKLYRGFARNLTLPFRFVLFTDNLRLSLPFAIDQRPLTRRPISYGSFTEPYRLNEPMILVGLDTVITGNLDHLASYCLRDDAKLLLPRDPYMKSRACNGAALVPAGRREIFDNWSGENDMDWIRLQPHAFIDDLFPGQVSSFKGSVRDNGLCNSRIVYFHGRPKSSEVLDLPWVAQNWQ